MNNYNSLSTGFITGLKSRLQIKGLLFLLFAFFSVISVNAQLTGTKNIPGDYATLAAAITDLNTQGVGAGGVTLNLVAGNPETAPAGGYSITTLTGTLANPIIITGNGNTITAPTPQASGSLNDAIFKIIGGDFITIQNFTMLENAANTTTAAASNNMTEWGVALLYISTTNGAQNCTIQNNTITLNRTYQNTFGIYSNSTHSATVVSTTANATTSAGGNSGLKIYGNSISNVNQGIVVVGPTTAADANTGIDIGGSSLAQGNTITNFGTTGTFSSYINVSGTVNGILVRNSNGFNVSYNTVTSSLGGTTVGTLNGIQVPAASATPTGTFTNTISNNTISLQSGLIAGAINGINYPSGSASTTSTLNINSNNFNNFGHTVAGTAAIIFISTASTNQFTTINSNTFTNISLNTTGSVTFISHGYSIPTTGSLIINGNSIVGTFNKTGAGGTVTLTTSNSVSGTGSINNYTNNNFSNITVTGATGIIGFNNTDGGTGSAKTITGNTFNSWIGGTSAINTMNITYWNGVSSLSNNTITNITGQAAVTGITIGSSANNATSINISGNTINNLSSTGTGGAVTGIICSNTSPSIDISGNAINTLSSTGASAVNGITVSGAATTNVFKNKIYDLSGSNASSTVNGLLVSGGTTVNAYNNIIGDLRTPAANAANPLVGINITGGTNVNAHFNTVNLNATSSGALFGSSSISVSTSPTVTLRNNIFVNTSVPNGAAFTVAHRRSSVTLTSYAAASNNNLLYTIAPSNANYPFYTDGTVFDLDIASYKVRMTTASPTRETVAVSEVPAFLSTTGSSAQFLHIDTATPTLIESGGVAVAGVTDDFDGDTRAATPDIGADEFAGIPKSPSISLTSATPALTSQCTKADRAIVMNIISNATSVNPASVVLSYSHDGVAQTPVTLFNSSGNLWEGTMLAPTVGNATVTWSVAATNDIGNSSSYTGASFSDEPLTGVTASANASLTTLCAGGSTVLTAALSKAGTTVITPALPAATASSYSNPLYSNWANNRSQILILGSELTASGLAAGNITSMSFPLTSTSTTLRTDYTIKIGTTAATALTTAGFQTSTFTTVYSASYTPAVGTNTFTFTTPFNWDGTSNIVIETCWDNTTSTATVSSSATAQTTSFNSVISYNRTSTTGTSICGAVNTPITAYNSRPLITFDGNTAPAISSVSWSDGVTSTSGNNLSVVPPTGSTTYTATIIYSGCTATPSPSVAVTVNPVPDAPIGTDSTQCGNQIPTASVANPGSNVFSGAAIFKWYADNVTTTALQNSTSTTYLTAINADATFYVSVVNPTTLCESTRTPVSVTVQSPQVINVTPGSTATVCQNGTITLGASSGPNTYTYSWTASPEAGSGIVNASPLLGASVNVTPTGTGPYTYTVSGTDGNCANINTVTVTITPAPVIVIATPAPICPGGSATLTAQTSVTGFGTAVIGTGTTLTSATAQPTAFCNRWPSYRMQTVYTAAELQAAGLAAGNITSMAFNITTLGDGATNSGFEVKIGTTASSTLSGSFVSTASGFTTVYPSQTYTHTASGWQTIPFSTPYNWDGTSNIIVEVIHNGANLTNNSITYYTATAGNTVAYTTTSASNSASFSANRLNVTFGGQAQTTGVGSLVYNWTSPATPGNELTVSPSATTTYEATGYDSTTTCTGKQTVTVTVNTPPAAPSGTDSSQCAPGVPTASVSSPLASPTFNWYADNNPLNITPLQSSSSTTYNTSISGTTTFYVSVTNVAAGCESARTPVTVTVHTPGTISVTGTATICSGQSTPLTASPLTGTIVSYAWLPVDGLVSAVGSSVSASPSATTTYTVTGQDSNGCFTPGVSVIVTVNQAPSAVTVTPTVDTGLIVYNSLPNDYNICAENIVKLTAAGGTVNGLNTILTEDFNTDAPNWVVTNGASSPAVSNWSYQSAPLTDATGATTFLNFSTLNGGKFAYSNSDNGGSGSTTNTVLTSPSFSTVGFTNANLSFEQGYFNWTSGDANVKVEISTDGGGAWTTLVDYIGLPQGTTTSNAQTTVPVTISLASYLNQSNLKIRYNYVSTWGYYWIVDNIVINGNYPVNVTQNWTASSGTLYTDAAATPGNEYVAGTPAAVVYAKPTATTTYSFSAANGTCPTTGSATVNVNALPVVNIMTPLSICFGTPGQFTASSTTSNSYVWEPIGGGTNLIGLQPFANPSVNTTYNVTTTNSTYSPACSSVTQAQVIVNDLGSIIAAGTTTSRLVSVGQPTTFVVNTSGTGLTYQWQVDKNDTFGFNNILAADPNYTGENTPTLSVTGITTDFNNYQYQCIVTGASPCLPLNPIVATLTVSNTGFDPQPADVNLCGATSTQFSIGASGDNPYNVQWQMSTDDGANYNYIADGFDSITGLTFSGTNELIINSPTSASSTLLVSGITTTHSGYKFRGELDYFQNSDPATLTVNTPVSITSDLSTDPTYVCKETTETTLSISTSGTVAGVQWKYALSPGGPWNALNVATPAGITYTNAVPTTLKVTTTAATPNGNYYYQATVIGAGSGPGKCPDMPSLIATISKSNPTVVATPLTSVYCSPGPAITLTASGALTYAWNPTTDLSSGGIGDSVSATPSATRTYTVTGTNLFGCTNTASVTVTRGTAPIIATASASALTVCPSAPVQLTGAASGLGTQTALTTYNFSQSTNAYTSLTGDTVLATQTTPTGTAATALDDVNYTLALPFDFSFAGVNYASATNIVVNSNGFVAFGTAPSTGTYTPISTATASGVLSAFGRDLNGGYGATGSNTLGSPVLTITTGSTEGYTIGAVVSGTGVPTGATVVSTTATTVTLSANCTSTGTARTFSVASGRISYKVSGSSPNRQLTIQYSKIRPYNVNLITLDFQIVLNETTNVVSFIYGNPIVTGATSTGTAQVGLRGATTANFNNRTSTTSWSTTTAGAANTNTVSYSSAIMPATGLTFEFSPAPPAATATFAWSGDDGYTNTGASVTANPAVSAVYTVTATATPSGCTATATVNVGVDSTPPTITSTASPQTICQGDTVNFTVAATSPSPVTYRWRKDGNLIPLTNASAGTTTLTLTNTTPSDNGSYTVDVIGCTTVSSNPYALTVNPSPTAVTVSGAGTFCSSTTITASNGGSGTIYFQGTTSGGTSTASSDVSPTITSSGTYYFRAQSAAGCWGPEGSVTVVIEPLAGITVTPANSCQNEASTTLAATAANCIDFVVGDAGFSGTFTTSDPQAPRPLSGTSCSFSTTSRGYQAKTFTVLVTGSYTFAMSSTFDTMAYLTTGTFTPGSCATGTFIVADDDAGPDLNPQFTTTLTAGVVYTLYSTTFSEITSDIAYTWAVTSPVGGGVSVLSTGNIVWFTAPSGGTSIGSGSTFNPVGVLNSGLANTSTPGTTTFYAACSGSTTCRTPVTYTIHPTPTVAAIANQLYYNGLATASIPLSGTPLGVTFDISGGAGVGLINQTVSTEIPSFTPITGSATVTVTPKANGCTGPSVTYNIVVAAVNADPVANQTYCEGITTSAIPLTSTPTSLTGVTYNLQVVGDNIGLSDATGLTAIPAFVTQPGSATIYITPVYGGVSGGVVSATITVNPLPTATIAGTTQVCQNDASPIITFTGAVGLAPYTFTYTFNGGPNQTIVSSGSGTTATITIPTGTAGTFAYTLVSVQDSSSTTCSQAQGGTATVIVHPTPTVTTILNNQNYYSGFPTAAIPLAGTPSGVTFNITGGAAAGLADVYGVSAIPSFIPTTVPATVTVTPVANGCIGIPKTYQIIFIPVVANITSSQCGTINNGLNNQIQAGNVSVPGYTTTGYRFEVTNTATGEVAYVDNVQSMFKLTDTSIYSYGTTFAIRVAVILDGNVQGFFGNTCLITTASVQTTKVVTAQCGATLAALNSNINANSVSSTNLYRFRVALASAPTTYYLLERSVPNFNLSMVVGLPLTYETEYRVDVQIRVKLAGFEAWSQYGAVCSIFTPEAPTTSLTLADCELVATSSSQAIHIIPYPGATSYRVLLTGYDGNGDVNYSQFIDTASTTFTLSQFSGLSPDTAYNVEIAINLFGNYTPYGKTCLVTTPGALKAALANNPFKAVAYPNPFANNFMIDVKSSSQSSVSLKVYDMIGRLVEQRDVRVSDLETATIGERYPSGVYNVVVSQDDSVQTVRVVKR